MLHPVPCDRCGGPVDAWFPEVAVWYRRTFGEIRHYYPRMCDVYLMLPLEQRGVSPVEALDLTRGPV